MRAPPLVATREGWLEGAWQDGVAAFRAIPYAAAPVGELRFAAPQPPPAWRGVRAAARPGPSQPQPWSLNAAALGHVECEQDEASLHANVFSPDLDARLPVMLWIHGGAKISGSGAWPHYSGAPLARRGRIVVVTINYRLGLLGYLQLADLGGDPAAASNPALRDALAALRWVHANIAAFGGDPDAITIAGQSNGGCSVAHLMAIPAAGGLFRRAVLMSPALSPPIAAARAAAVGRRVTGAMGAGGDPLGTLRSLPVRALLDAQAELIESERRPANPNPPLGPVLDGELCPADPVDAIVAGAAPGVDVLIGTTRHEYWFHSALDPLIEAVDRRRAAELLRPLLGERATQMLDAYAELHPGEPPATILRAILGDAVFGMPSARIADARAARGAPLWLYRFDWESPAQAGRFRAAHCLDLPFAFDTFDAWRAAPFLEGARPRALRPLIGALHGALAAFVATGDPNHDGLPAWPRYAGDRPAMMRFAARSEAAPAWVAERRGLWEPFGRGAAADVSRAPAAPAAAA